MQFLNITKIFKDNKLLPSRKLYMSFVTDVIQQSIGSNWIGFFRGAGLVMYANAVFQQSSLHLFLVTPKMMEFFFFIF